MHEEQLEMYLLDYILAAECIISLRVLHLAGKQYD